MGRKRGRPSTQPDDWQGGDKGPDDMPESHDGWEEDPVEGEWMGRKRRHGHLKKPSWEDDGEGDDDGWDDGGDDDGDDDGWEEDANWGPPDDSWGPPDWDHPPHGWGHPTPRTPDPTHPPQGWQESPENFESPEMWDESPESHGQCDAMQRFGETTCTVCNQCFKRRAAPNVAKVVTFERFTDPATKKNMVTLQLKISDDMIGNTVCPVTDFTLRVRQTQTWVAANVFVPKTVVDGSCQPHYQHNCDAIETGLLNTMFWNTAVDLKTGKSTSTLSVTWAGNYGVADVFQTAWDTTIVNGLQQHLQLDSPVEDSLIFVVTTDCGCHHGFMTKREFTSMISGGWTQPIEASASVLAESSSSLGDGWRGGWANVPSGQQSFFDLATGLELTAAGCAGPFTAAISLTPSLLTPIMLVSQSAVTLSNNVNVGVKIKAGGKLAPGSYVQQLLIDFAGPAGSAACLSSLLDHLVTPDAVFTGMDAAVVDMDVRPSPKGTNSIQVTINVDVVVAPTVAKAAVLKSLMGLKHSLDPLGQVFSAWTPFGDFCTFPGLSCSPDGTLTGINLSKMGLAGSLPSYSAVWAGLRSLTTLNLAGNALTGEVPHELQQLINLYDLDLSGNKLSGCMPPEVQAFSAATRVLMSNNPGLCGGVPHPLAIKTCAMFDNTLTSFPCFNAPVELVMDGATEIPIGQDVQLLYTCEPDPLMLEHFNALAVFYQLTKAPGTGTLFSYTRNAALKPSDQVPLADLLTGRVRYQCPATGCANFDAFTFQVSVQQGDQWTIVVDAVQFLILNTAEPWGFPADTWTSVQDAKGVVSQVDLKDLQSGDRVKSVCDDGSVCYDTVYLLPVRKQGGFGSFVQIQTEQGNVVILAPDHYIPVTLVAGMSVSTASLTAAKNVKVGSYVWLEAPWDKTKLISGRVNAIVYISARGNVLPLTLKGKMLVNGVAVSTNVDASASDAEMYAALQAARNYYASAAALPNSTVLQATLNTIAGIISDILDSPSADIKTFPAKLDAALQQQAAAPAPGFIVGRH
ncbi:hypothetical protein WJX72_010216 [[Myrmecia] bisecta]|uniref:Hedgehog protein Hint domain-containing protein n=1 Tax=[Myrmecia] bisecta TaxID=41462 RepID=A0AAW1Q9Y5_9CHLO